MHGLGEKGSSFPEGWCPVLIKFVIEIDCDCRPARSQGCFYRIRNVFFFCVTTGRALLVAAVCRISE